MRTSFLIVFTLIVMSGFSQKSTPFSIDNSNWVATDGLGRVLPTYKEVGQTKKDKYVGLFYYIWHGYHAPTDTIYDLTKIIANNPSDPKYGPVGQFHYWGESEAGHYRSDDPWVIRRNIAMLASAGVDFIYFDVTNSFTYLNTVERYCQISLKMREKGINAPYIAFMTNSNSGRVMNELYDEFYSNDKFKDLWFYWEGKPIIFGQPEDSILRSDVRNFFNIKYSWAWTNAQENPNHWQWLDTYPQDYGWSTKGIVDQVPVSVASHPYSNIGTSYSNGKQPAYDKFRLTPFTGQGLYFEEQWSQVFKLQPKVVMITQWNEWKAQRFVNGEDALIDFLGVPGTKGSTYFVDAYNEEYNRDIEPMKGGHTDNLYYQMVSNIRHFKGMEQPQKISEPKTINIDGKFNEWYDVSPVFYDYEGDTYHRNHKGANENTTYINNTGRNDIIESRVTYDNQYVFFYAKTVDALTHHTDQNWMLLYINTDCLKKTGWEGYDLLVNHNPINLSRTQIKRFEKGAWSKGDEISYSYANNEIEIAVPISYFNVIDNKLIFSFKWVDNSQKLLDIREFFINGDSAPDRRFDYYFDNTQL